MQIGGLKKISLVDYPGKVSCVVFLAGCNFQCPWCYSFDFKKNISKKDFFEFLKRKKMDGVVIDGGEPTIHKMLPWFLENIKKCGYSVKLNTNGSNPEILKKLIKDKLVDFIEMDVKAPPEKYGQIIGFDDCSVHHLVNKVKQSIELIKKSGVEYQFTTTWVPILSREDILKIVHWIRPAKSYRLKNFKPGKTLDGNFENLAPYPDKEIIQVKQAIAPFLG